MVVVGVVRVAEPDRAGELERLGESARATPDREVLRERVMPELNPGYWPEVRERRMPEQLGGGTERFGEHGGSQQGLVRGRAARSWLGFGMQLSTALGESFYEQSSSHA